MTDRSVTSVPFFSNACFTAWLAYANASHTDSRPFLSLSAVALVERFDEILRKQRGVLLRRRVGRGNDDAVFRRQRRHELKARARGVDEHDARRVAVERGLPFARVHVWADEIELRDRAVGGAVADEHHQQRVVRGHPPLQAARAHVTRPRWRRWTGPVLRQRDDVIARQSRAARERGRERRHPLVLIGRDLLAAGHAGHDQREPLVAPASARRAASAAAVSRAMSRAGASSLSSFLQGTSFSSRSWARG